MANAKDNITKLAQYERIVLYKFFKRLTEIIKEFEKNDQFDKFDARKKYDFLKMLRQEYNANLSEINKYTANLGGRPEALTKYFTAVYNVAFTVKHGSKSYFDVLKDEMSQGNSGYSDKVKEAEAYAIYDLNDIISKLEDEMDVTRGILKNDHGKEATDTIRLIEEYHKKSKPNSGIGGFLGVCKKTICVVTLITTIMIAGIVMTHAEGNPDNPIKIEQASKVDASEFHKGDSKSVDNLNQIYKLENNNINNHTLKLFIRGITPDGGVFISTHNGSYFLKNSSELQKKISEGVGENVSFDKSIGIAYTL
jgi:hypothetical protein